MPALAPVFRAAYRGALSPEIDLEQTLEEILSGARAAWPEVDLEPAAFVRCVAERLPADRDTRDALAKLHGADLYLACACARGDPEALARLERSFLRGLRPFLSRLDSCRAHGDEAAQLLREKLLVAPDGETPRIAEYAGQGSLESW